MNGQLIPSNAKMNPKYKKIVKLGRTIKPYLFVTPAIGFLLVFTIYPIFKSIGLSFYDTDAIQSFMEFVGLKHYRDMFANNVFWEVMGNTMIYSVLQVVLTTVLGLLFALIANSKRNRCSSLFKVSLFYPYILPWTVAAMVWIYMLNPTRGIFNILLGTRIQWLNSYDLTLYVLIIICVWKTVGYNFLLFLSGLQSIPEELYEASKMETNSAFKTFWYITRPLLSPTTFIAVLFSIVGSFQSIDLIYIMTSGGPENATNTLIYYIYQQGIIRWNVGYGSALSTVLFVILLIFTILYIILGERRINYDR